MSSSRVRWGVGFKALFRCVGLRKQYLEHPPGSPHHTFIFAYTYAEFDDGTLGVPSGIGRKPEKHAPPEYVLLMF